MSTVFSTGLQSLSPQATIVIQARALAEKRIGIFSERLGRLATAVNNDTPGQIRSSSHRVECPR